MYTPNDADCTTYKMRFYTATFNANTCIVLTIYNILQTPTAHLQLTHLPSLDNWHRQDAHYCFSSLKNTIPSSFVQIHWPPMISLEVCSPFQAHVSTKHITVCEPELKVSIGVETGCVHKQWHPRKEKPHFRPVQLVRYWQEL